MANALSRIEEQHPARRASDRGAGPASTDFPILDGHGDIVRTDRRIPEQPRSNIEVEWLPVAVEVSL